MAIEGGVFERISLILNVVFHQAVAVLSVYIVSVVLTTQKIDSLSTWHMVLTPLGVMLLMMESFMVFHTSNIFTLNIPRSKVKYVHSVLQWLSTILITIGIAFRIDTKEGSHFNTTHGVLGLSAWILMWISIFIGIATMKAQELKNFVKPAWLKLFHILIGCATFTLAVVSLGYGLHEYFVWLSNKKLVNGAISTMGILYAWTLYDALKSVYTYIRNIVGK